MSQVLHERTNGAFDEAYIKWSRRLSPPGYLGEAKFLDETAINGAVVELNRDGCSVLPRKLSKSDIEEITAFAFSTPAYDLNLAKEIVIRTDAIPRNTARHVWQIGKIIRIPAVQRLMLDPTFHSIAQSYLRATPLLTSVTLWIDAPADKVLDAHRYHYDNDGPGFLKFFFYLTDVDVDTGAHCFMKRTHSHRKPPPFRLAKLYNDEELHAHYGRDTEIMFAAPRGTIIAEDTAGFHRGSTTLSAHRLLMQFQYSVIDIPREEELKGVFKPVEVDEIPLPLRPILAKLLISKR